MAINNFEKRIDSVRENSPETAKVPMTKHPYNPTTLAQQKLDLSSGGRNVNTPVPAGGRDIAGYGQSKSIGPGATGAHLVTCEESGTKYTHTRVKGKVLKTTNHPNTRINGIYG